LVFFNPCERRSLPSKEYPPPPPHTSALPSCALSLGAPPEAPTRGPLLLPISPPYSFPLRLLTLLVLILFRVPPYLYRSTQVARRPSHWLRRCFYTSPASHAVFPSVVVRPREARRMLLVHLIYEAVCGTCSLLRIITRYHPSTNQPVM
jgi:hypothetical protein